METKKFQGLSMQELETTEGGSALMVIAGGLLAVAAAVHLINYIQSLKEK